MDTNNLDKWWYGLPENTRQAIGNDGIWEKLDMPSRSALHRYSRLRIYGTAKDRDEERTLLNEIACGLGDLALVRKNGIALEKMCNGNGEFYDEYQEQFDILYDNYGHTIENISCRTGSDIQFRQTGNWSGYWNITVTSVWKSIPTEESRKLSMFSVVGCTSTQARTCLTTSYRNRTVSDWGVLRYALPKTVKAPSWELTVPGSF